ncbi:MAG TPA: HDOD domain-containing protein, partial [Candidatus Hydrogenedentes bacterium]|nr:HDOD domain-containing protein [Candidatus Hydrogenedentota bacterium]
MLASLHLLIPMDRRLLRAILKNHVSTESGSSTLAEAATKLLIVCSCGQKMKVPASTVGKTVKCVNCGDAIVISAEQESPAPDPIPANFEIPNSPNSAAPPMPALDDATDLLVNSGMVDQAMLDDAMLVQRDLPGTTWSILMDMGCLDSDAFHELLSKEEGIASIELDNYSVPDDVGFILPENVVRQHFVVPVDKLGKLLTMAMVCPRDKSVIKEAENITGLRVKTMLCTYNAMRDTIKSMLPYSNVEGDDSITLGLAKEFEKQLNDRIIARRVFRQHSLPPSSTEMSQIDGTPGDDIVQLAQVASNNPVFLGKVLHLANSAAYGFSGHITSYAQAAALLGPEALRTAMHSDEMIDYKKQHKTYDIGNHLQRSRFCAMACQALANELESADSDTAYSIGLLFEIGRLVLLQALPNGYAMATRDEIGGDLHKIESRLYQFTHTEAGYYMLRKWNLPHSILEPVRFQVEPENSIQQRVLSNVLFLAVVMTKAYVNNEPLHIRTDEENALHLLKMPRETYESVFQAICTAFQQKTQAG